MVTGNVAFGTPNPKRRAKCGISAAKSVRRDGFLLTKSLELTERCAEGVVSACRLAKGPCPFDEPAVFRDIWPTRISVGTRMRIPGGTEMRQPLRRLVYLRICETSGPYCISVGTRMRIPGGTEMRGVCKSGLASRGCRPRYTEYGTLCQRRRFGPRKWCLGHTELETLCRKRRINPGNAAQNTQLAERCARSGMSSRDMPPTTHRTGNVVPKAACAGTKRRLGHAEHGTLCQKRHVVTGYAAWGTQNGK